MDDEQFEGAEAGEGDEAEPKISLVEVVAIGIAVLIADILSAVPIIGTAVSLVAGALMFFYLYLKGLWGTNTIAVNLIAYIVEAIPILQAFPAMTLAWIVVVVIDRNPKLEAVTEKVGQLEKGGGAAGAVGEAAGAAEGVAAKAGSAALRAESAAGEAEGAIVGIGAGEEEVASEASGTSASKSARRQRGYEGGSEEAGAEGEEQKPEDEDQVDLRSGAMISPEEELDEELFNPEEAKFREARDISTRRTLQEDDQGGENPEENNNLKKAA